MLTTYCRDDHPESVLSAMQTIMIVVLEESEDVRDDLLLVILSALGRNKSVRISYLLLAYCLQIVWLLIFIPQEL